LEFEDLYFSVAGLPGGSVADAIKLESGMPRQYEPPEEPPPFPLLQNSLNLNEGFRYSIKAGRGANVRGFDYPFAFTTPFLDDLVMLSYS
jgi:hypothetical protein